MLTSPKHDVGDLSRRATRRCVIWLVVAANIRGCVQVLRSQVRSCWKEKRCQTKIQLQNSSLVLRLDGYRKNVLLVDIATTWSDVKRLETSCHPWIHAFCHRSPMVYQCLSFTSTVLKSHQAGKVTSSPWHGGDTEKSHQVVESHIREEKSPWHSLFHLYLEI